MTKHTPGPWRYDKSTDFGDIRFYVSQEEGAPYTSNYSDVATVIAESCAGDPLMVQEANARLIAAAPELLEALEEMINKATKQNWNDQYPEILKKAFAAADKARGEA